MLFGERVGWKNHSVTDGCQNEVTHGSVEGINHQCEIRTERDRAEGNISKACGSKRHCEG